MLFRRTLMPFSLSRPIRKYNISIANLRIVAENQKYLIETCNERNKYIIKDKIFDVNLEKKIVFENHNYIFQRDNKQITCRFSPVNEPVSLLKYADWLYTDEPKIAAALLKSNGDKEYQKVFESIGTELVGAIKEGPIPIKMPPLIGRYAKFLLLMFFAYGIILILAPLYYVK